MKGLTVLIAVRFPVPELVQGREFVLDEAVGQKGEYSRKDRIVMTLHQRVICWLHAREIGSHQSVRR